MVVSRIEVRGYAGCCLCRMKYCNVTDVFRLTHRPDFSNYQGWMSTPNKIEIVPGRQRRGNSTLCSSYSVAKYHVAGGVPADAYV